MEKWTKEEIEKGLEEMRERDKCPPQLEGDPELGEEADHDESGELFMAGGGPCPRDVHFVEGDKVGPFVLGRVVHCAVRS